ncbi:MAG: thioesterase [Ignavibacteria bacterium]|nr:thioesterase [Ignavibacteria bacterium]
MVQTIVLNFKHSYKGRVQFPDVDSFGIVHNLRYFYWLEYARTDYFKSIGVKINKDSFTKEFTVNVVHAEIDYFAPARFDEEWEVLTRISKIGSTSFTFDNIIRMNDGTILAKASAVLVYINPKSLEPERVPDWLRTLINNFEDNK